MATSDATGGRELQRAGGIAPHRRWLNLAGSVTSNWKPTGGAEFARGRMIFCIPPHWIRRPAQDYAQTTTQFRARLLELPRRLGAAPSPIRMRAWSRWVRWGRERSTACTSSVIEGVGAAGAIDDPARSRTYARPSSDLPAWPMPVHPSGCLALALRTSRTI